MIDGVTIINEIEVVQAMNATFNLAAAFIALIITVLTRVVVGFFTGRADCAEFEGAVIGFLVGLVFSTITGSIFGFAFQDPPVTETTMQYEVIIDDSVSLTEFYEHYNVIEQRGKIFVVEEKSPE